MARGSLNTNYFGNVKAKATRKICIVVIAKSNQSMQNFDQMRRRRRLRHARQISPFCRCCDGAAARGRAIAYGPNRTGLMVRGAPQAAPLTMRVCPFAAKQALVPRHSPEANVGKDGRERASADTCSIDNHSLIERTQLQQEPRRCRNSRRSDAPAAGTTGTADGLQTEMQVPQHRPPPARGWLAFSDRARHRLRLRLGRWRDTTSRARLCGKGPVRRTQSRRRSRAAGRVQALDRPSAGLPIS